MAELRIDEKRHMWTNITTKMIRNAIEDVWPMGSQILSKSEIADVLLLRVRFSIGQHHFCQPLDPATGTPDFLRLEINTKVLSRDIARFALELRAFLAAQG